MKSKAMLPTEQELAKRRKIHEVAEWKMMCNEELLHPSSNTFVVAVNVPLPEEKKAELNVWLNQQHTGKRIFGEDTIIPETLKTATHNLHKTHCYKMRFRINIQGNWIFEGFE